MFISILAVSACTGAALHHVTAATCATAPAKLHNTTCICFCACRVGLQLAAVLETWLLWLLNLHSQHPAVPASSDSRCSKHLLCLTHSGLVQPSRLESKPLHLGLLHPQQGEQSQLRSQHSHLATPTLSQKHQHQDPGHQANWGAQQVCWRALDKVRALLMILQGW